jgi:hypothetical protein
MLFADVLSVGIDSTSGRREFTFAALDRDLKLIALAEAELDEVAAFLIGQDSVVVAVNSPSHLNAGIVRKRLEALSLTPHAIRGAEIREAEFELHARGIQVSSTPGTEALCPAWMQLGFDLHRRLAKLKFKPFPDEAAPHQWMETHPHAAFCALLGSVPLPKPTLEGRLQRGLALFERGLGIRDPMIFLEEITRHRLLHGFLPTDLLLSPEQLDALVAAYTAFLGATKPAEITRLGNRQEGFVTLPAPQLKEKYQSFVGQAT